MASNRSLTGSAFGPVSLSGGWIATLWVVGATFPAFHASKLNFTVAEPVSSPHLNRASRLYPHVRMLTGTTCVRGFSPGLAGKVISATGWASSGMLLS